MSIFLALAAGFTAPVAQAAPPAPTEAVDPARLVAAKRTLDALMPPNKRATMIDAMLAPMMANIQQTMLSMPSLKAALAKDPKGETALQRFIAQQQQRTTERLRTSLPGMFAAMERAYARRFTVAQLDEVTAFFATPTGRAYMDQGMTIMSDPDVMAWQREMMLGAMAGIEADMKTLAADLEAESGK